MRRVHVFTHGIGMYGEVIAALRPARRQRREEDQLEEILDSLVNAGEITRASARKSDWSAKGLGLPAGTVLGLVREVRGEPG